MGDFLSLERGAAVKVAERFDLLKFTKYDCANRHISEKSMST